MAVPRPQSCCGMRPTAGTLRALQTHLRASYRSYGRTCKPWQLSSTAPSSHGSTKGRPLVVLGIESSCDDTAAAVVRSDGQVLGEAIASQAEIHAPWGGVVPSLAQQAHRDAIDRVVSKALDQASLTPSQLDAVAVTIGPGLSLCLDVGVRKAHALSRSASLPLVHVHHMEAHALVARMAAGGPDDLPYPFLCLLVSGGHNLLMLVKGTGHYVQLGSTLDDALGEAYDKVARMLGLEMNPHGGAALEKLARQGDPDRYPFAVPMKKHANCDFSYAGLKTSVRLCIERELGQVEGSGKSVLPGNASKASTSSSSSSSSQAESSAGAAEGSSSPDVDQVKADVAASFQRVAVAHLVGRVKRGIAWAQEELGPEGFKHLVVAGGVAANQYVRQKLTQVSEAAGLQLVFPPPRWCTDNGVMVAWAGIERYRLGLFQPPLEPLAEGDAPEWVELRPRWPLTSERHARSMPQVISMKKVDKMHTSLTELTQAALQHKGGAQQQQPLQASEQQEQLAA